MAAGTNNIIARLRVLGSSRFAQDMDRAAASVGRLGTGLKALGAVAAVFAGAQVMGLVVGAAGAGVIALGALGAAAAGAGAAIGVMALAATQRFKATADQVGSVANQVQSQMGLLKSAFSDATAAGADKVLAGLIPILRGVRSLVKSLEPAFTALGTAMGKAMAWFGEGIAELRPELDAMMRAAAGLFQPIAEALLPLISLIARAATEAMPYLIKGLEAIPPLLMKMQQGITNGAIGAAFDTIGTAVRGLLSMLQGIAQVLGPVLGPAARDFRDAVDAVGNDAGRVLGLLAAGFVQIAHGALPGLVALIKEMRPALQSIVDSGALQTLGEIAGAVIGTMAKGISGLIGWLDKVGALKPLIVGVVAAFAAWRVAVIAMSVVSVLAAALGVLQGVMMAVNFAMAANPIGAVVIAIAALVAGLVLAYRKVGWFRDAVNAVWGALKAVGEWIGSNWQTILKVLIAPIYLGVQAFKALRSGAGGAVDWIKSKFTGLISFLTGLPGKVVAAASSIGKSIVEGIASGIKAAGNLIVDALTAIIPGPLKDVLKAAGGALGALGDFVFRADGGPIPGGGPYTDRVPAMLTPGEHVWTRQEVAAAGGHGAVEQLRASAGRGAATGPLVSAPRGGLRQPIRVVVEVSKRAIAETIAEIELDLDAGTI